MKGNIFQFLTRALMLGMMVGLMLGIMVGMANSPRHHFPFIYADFRRPMVEMLGIFKKVIHQSEWGTINKKHRELFGSI